MALAGWSSLLACTQNVNQVPSAPTVVRYEIAFPDTAAAVAADSVQVQVFDATAPAGACLALVTGLSALPGPPVLLAASQAATPCELFAATAAEADDGGLTGQDGTILDVPYGERSVLAVVQRAGANFFVGCASTTITSATSVVRISVLPIMPSVVVPPTACSTLADKCSGTCS